MQDTNATNPTNVMTGGQMSEQEVEKFLEGKTEEEMVDLFLDQLLVDKGLDELADDLKAEVRADLKERLIIYINQAVIELLPEEKLNELDASLENGSATEETINQMIAETGIDASDAVARAMLEFREAYLGGESEEE